MHPLFGFQLSNLVKTLVKQYYKVLIKMPVLRLRKQRTGQLDRLIQATPVIRAQPTSNAPNGPIR